MVPTGSKTKPRKTSMSQLKNGRTSPPRKSPKPSPRPATAGCDGVANFWFKQLTSLHPELANAYNKILKNPQQSLGWLTEGMTFLIRKSKDTENPKNCRPITCLPNTYKVLTSIIAERVYIFLESNNLLP